MPIKMTTFLTSQRKRLTRIRLSGAAINLTIDIEAFGTIHEDKELVRSFVRNIRPWLKYFNHSNIKQTDLKGTCGIENPLEKTGFEIRMKRLKAGLTQKQLAQLARLDQKQISRIERAKTWPRPKTLDRIRLALVSSDPQTQPKPPLHPHPLRSQSVYMA